MGVTDIIAITTVFDGPIWVLPVLNIFARVLEHFGYHYFNQMVWAGFQFSAIEQLEWHRLFLLTAFNHIMDGSHG